MTEPQIKITRKQFKESVLEYIKDNQNKPKNQQTQAYKNLETLFKEKNIPIEEIPEFIEELLK